MRDKNGCGITIAIGVITSIITIMSLAIAMFVILDHKKKKEDRELEEYLESTIS